MAVEGIIEQDVGLAYKLLRTANSVYFGAIHRIQSIRQALVRIGTAELRRWVQLMLLQGVQTPENEEL
ncbi:MAG: HDOD domain-containing protein [Candidatus Pelethousia sp.]|nr:HDOD domain-containing protein [Candidatus Pelethousia sp.]